MKYMNWSEADLLLCSDDIVVEILEMMREEVRERERHGTRR
jgi:hypothetical protein